jgi:16S rRNA G966 N2-methylase RsmD
MKPSSLIENNEIFISEEMWTHMNKKMDRAKIKALISDAIDDLPLPYKPITMMDAAESFQKLKAFDARTLIKKGETFTRYDYNNYKPIAYIDSSTIGSEASDFFHQENRWKCDSINAPSPERSWNDRKFRDGLLNALWTLKFKEITSKELRSAIALRKYIASQFRPSAAKALYQHFDAKRVLDFSAGWGDRLCAFSACENTEHYFGVDPNAKVHQEYNEQIPFYHVKKKYDLLNACAEDVEFRKNYFDFVFTSPPYFNIERYTGTHTKDLSQSWQRYKTLDSWLNYFLFAAIERSWDALAVGGTMAINISDVYSGHKVNKICDPMNWFIGSLSGAVYQGSIGLKMAKRPQSKSDKSGVFVEPIWIWKKG